MLRKRKGKKIPRFKMECKCGHRIKWAVEDSIMSPPAWCPKCETFYEAIEEVKDGKMSN